MTIFFNKYGIGLSLAVIIFILLGALGYGGYRYQLLTKGLAQAKIDLASSTQSFGQTLADLENKNSTLIGLLNQERGKNNSFSSQLDQITNTVDALTRLSKTDKELLQKYSKVYFLNENYVPSDLTMIDTRYLYLKNKPLQMHDRVWPYLKNLLDDASASGTPMQVISAYRSFSDQVVVKSNYKITYGAGTANSFSADQGYSEHQLGTTLDLTTPKIGATLANFDKSDAFAWLAANAYKYGFALSYPKSNTYYQFEPWHWRFVGITLATKLHEANKYFYDLDQREINTYLINIFNQ